MKNFLILLVALAVANYACRKNDEKRNFKDSDADQKVIEAEISRSDTLSSQPVLIRLNEDAINGLIIPFEKKEMLGEIKKAFAGYDVVKEMGQQDGPDFPLYSVSQAGEELLYIAMDWEDTLQLNEIYIQSPMVADQYGVKVGDKFEALKQKRTDTIKTYTDYHFHTFAYVDDSKIRYEISGDLNMPDTVDLTDIKLTENQIKDWEVKLIVWTK